MGEWFKNLYQSGTTQHMGNLFDNPAHAWFKQHPFGDLEAFFSTFQTTYTQTFMDYSKGLQAYFEAPLPTFQPIGKPVWSRQGVTLYDVVPEGDGIPLLILAPLLLKPGVFRLSDRHDFLGFLVTSGYRPFVLDAGEDIIPEESFQSFCANRIFPAYGFLLGHLSEPPLMMACWEAIFWADALFEKNFPLKGGLLLGEPPVFQGTTLPPLWDMWGEAIVKPMLLQGHGVTSPFVRFFLSLETLSKVIEKMTRLGSSNQIFPDFLAAEDLFNQPRAMPHWLVTRLTVEKNWDDFFNKSQGFLERFKPIAPKQSLFWNKVTGLQAEQILNFPSGNYGLMVGSSAPFKLWPKVLQEIL